MCGKEQKTRRAELERSIKDLTVIYSGFFEAFVVPVGLTVQRRSVIHLEPFTKEDASKYYQLYTKWQDRIYEQYEFISFMQGMSICSQDRRCRRKSGMTRISSVENGVECPPFLKNLIKA